MQTQVTDAATIQEKLNNAKTELDNLVNGLKKEIGHENKVFDEEDSMVKDIDCHLIIKEWFEFYEHPNPDQWFTEVNGIPSGLDAEWLAKEPYTYQRWVCNRYIRYAIGAYQLKTGEDKRHYQALIIDAGLPGEWIESLKHVIAHLSYLAQPEEEREDYKRRMDTKEFEQKIRKEYYEKQKEDEEGPMDKTDEVEIVSHDCEILTEANEAELPPAPDLTGFESQTIHSKVDKTKQVNDDAS